MKTTIQFDSRRSGLRSRIPAVALGLVAALLTGCELASVHPFYRAGDLVWEPQLFATWKAADGDGFKLAPEDAARKRCRLESGEEAWQTHVFRLGNELYFDLYPAKPSEDTAAIPVHQLCRVAFKGDRLELRLVNADYLEELLNRRPRLIAHVRVPAPSSPVGAGRERIVLTAPTTQVQQFIRKHLKAAEAWSEPQVYRRG